MNEVGGFFSSVSCTRWHLANVSNDSAHMGEPIFFPENTEDSGRVWEAPRHPGFVPMAPVSPRESRRLV